MANQSATGSYQNWKSLFQPDVLAPLEYLARRRYRNGHVPEVKLMIAVLEDAVMCYQKFLHARTARGRELFEEAESWLFDEPQDGLFSFENICQVVGLDADYLRKGLVRLKENAERYPPHFRLFSIVGPGRKVGCTAKLKTEKPRRESFNQLAGTRKSDWRLK